MSLKGKVILNTRPRQQAAGLSEKIRALGGEVIELPLIDIVPVTPKFRPSSLNLNTFDVAIFTSTNAVDYFFENKAISWPQHLKALAIGQATAQRLTDNQIAVTETPRLSNSETLLETITLREVHDKNILIIKGKDGRAHLMNQLQRQGARITSVDVYERIVVEYDPLTLQSLWKKHRINLVLITSEQALQQLFTIIEPHQLAWLKNHTFVTLSDRLAAAAKRLGVTHVVVTPPEHMIQGLITASLTNHS